MKVIRTAYICKNCEAVYADEPTTECDCMEGEEDQSFYRGVIEYDTAHVTHPRPRSSCKSQIRRKDENADKDNNLGGLSLLVICLFRGRENGGKGPAQSERPQNNSKQRWYILNSILLAISGMATSDRLQI